ncbi:MAG: hypothetical protein NTY90_01130 [Candidatus Micrarchaeota archaeon]|nr:hypothetical protein [Candidatus Micrarchaeota archaeon]
MHRVIWLKIGSRRVHLVKLAGAFLVLWAVLKVAEAAYLIFVTAQKSVFAQARPDLVPQLFGWAIAAPYGFSNEDLLGVMLGPVAGFLFWLGVAVVALMFYQSGRIIFPVEEYEEKVREHHKRLIQRAVEAGKIKFGRK